jgi:hypothetical protein
MPQKSGAAVTFRRASLLSAHFPLDCRLSVAGYRPQLDSVIPANGTKRVRQSSNYHRSRQQVEAHGNLLKRVTVGTPAKVDAPQSLSTRQGGFLSLRAWQKSRLFKEADFLEVLFWKFQDHSDYLTVATPNAGRFVPANSRLWVK